ncbi:MAG: AAA family ATPase [Anaerolineales bacterium]|nr:AAA family ATPase [Anaerolineales bacterium]MCX7756473.1 AAA family ATPase [Anaerolineales bacterium]MDW8278346.1 adenylate/guanylate cyclase domain-containing protein [Anaerolineales bacterium]
MPTEPPNRYPEERRIATVLFADVHGFTSLAEQLDDETVSDLIKGIWLSLDKVIELHNGYIDKHLGDGIMAVWGAPFAGDNDAVEAVSAGLDLVKALNEYCQKSKIPGATHLKLRVGVNSGPVFAGYVGMRNEYTVIGDTVNVAARLEQIAEPGTVVIGESTLQMVQGSFRVKALQPTHVKGKAEAVQPYRVEGRLVNPGRIRYQSADSLVTHLVGRDEEMEHLHALYERTFESTKPVMALLSGEVGIGKSRLLMEFSNSLEARGDDIHLLSSRGLAQASKIPFYLWRVLLRNRFGVREEDSAPIAVERWTRGIEAVWDSDQPVSKVEATQVLGEMVGLAGNLNPSTEQLQRIFYLMRELLRQMGKRKHLVILLDDLQWADRESLQLLSYLLAAEVPPLQMFIVGAARPEFLKTQPQWHNQARVISLQPLELSCQRLRQAYPDLNNLPDSVLGEIAQRAEGNPYFLEEIVKSLLKAGLLSENLPAEELRARVLAQTPESLRATLQARLDSLSREARAVALLASVVGRVFWVGAVMAQARAAPLPGANPNFNAPEAVIDRFIQEGLRQLVRAELAFPRSGSRFSEEQEYIFKNSYLRDVAYSLIPNRSRALYHKAVAEWLRAKTDPAFQQMAQEHERSAQQSAKINTGTLTLPS